MNAIRSFKKPLQILALTSACSLLAVRALAGDYGHDPWRDAGRNAGQEYAEVVDVDPLVHDVRVSEPRQECREETRYERRGYGDRPSGGQMILGGLIGAVIGHQFGYGHARSNATIAGAVIGTAVGHDAAQRSRADHGYDDEDYGRPVSVERCRTRYEERYERRIDGYRVTYRYNGRLYTTQLPYDPGDRLPVHVTVEPWRRGG